MAGDLEQVSRRLAARPALATMASDTGATRPGPSTFFFKDIAHYLYQGDTALHMAAAAFRRPVAEFLVAHGADVHAKNRRGAEPLHYAADANRFEPDATGRNGHLSAVHWRRSERIEQGRRRAAAQSGAHAVARGGTRAAIDGGANPRLPNKAGVDALAPCGANHRTRREWFGILLANSRPQSVRLLLERGARVTDRDRHGKTVQQAATSDWTRTLLQDAIAG